MSQMIREENLQAQGGAGGNEEGQENIAAAPAEEEDAPGAPLGGEGENNQPGEVPSLDLQPLPYDSLSDPEKEAFDRLALDMLELSPPSLPFLKSLVTEYPKITMVKKATHPQTSFLLLAVTCSFHFDPLEAGTTDDSSVTDLLKAMIEINPSSPCFGYQNFLTLCA